MMTSISNQKDAASTMNETHTTPLKGLGMSPGTVEGTIHKAETLDALDDMDDGQILIVRRSSPAWTAGMLRAGGFICEEGGVICHAAIVARELGLPCVVDLKGALEAIPDGARVRLEVTGSEGVVHVLP